MAVFRYSGNWRGYLEGSSSTVSQNIAGNSSVIKVDVWIGMDAGWSIEFGNTYGNSVTVNCDGQSQTIPVGPLYLNGSKKYLGSVQFTVGHKPEGDKTAGISLSSNMSNISYGSLYLGNASGNWAHVLPPIPRSSSISFSTGTIGSPLAITINRASTSFTHTLRWAWGNRSGTIASGLTTSASWTIPMDFCNDIPNNVNGVGTIYVDTYSGTTKIGTSSSTLSLSVPSSMVPTINTKTVEETVAGLNTQFGTYVQNKSKIKATMTASGIYGSTIKSYKITANGETFDSDSGTTGELKTSGTNRVNFEVTDSRGRKATSYIDISVTAYENPKILSVSAIRCNEDGTTNDEGTYAKISFNASVAPVGNKNTKAFIVKYKKTGSTAWAEVDVTSETYSMNTHTIVAGFDVDYAYDIQLYVADYFTSITFSPTTLPTAFTLINYHPDGKAVAFGEVSDGFGFSVNLNAQFKKSVDASDMFIAGKALRDIFYPIGAIFQSTADTDPSTFIGGTWERFGNGRVLVGVDEADSDFNTPNKTGGAKTNTHSHSRAGDDGSVSTVANTPGGYIVGDKNSVSSKTISILQPYITVYMWLRTA